MSASNNPMNTKLILDPQSSQESKLSPHFLGLGAQNKTPLHRLFQREIEKFLYGVSQGRIGSWLGMIKHKQGSDSFAHFIHPHTGAEGSLPLDHDLTRFLVLSANSALMVNRNCIQVLKSADKKLFAEEKMHFSKIPEDKPYCFVTYMDKLSDTQVVGVREFSKNNYYDYYIWYADLQNKKIHQQRLRNFYEFMDVVEISALPEENRFALSTKNGIYIYQINPSALQQDASADFLTLCAKIETLKGPIFPSPCGKYWITKNDEKRGIDIKLWRVGENYQLTEVLSFHYLEISYERGHWFADHFLMHKTLIIHHPGKATEQKYKIYAVHPETLVTYDLCPSIDIENRYLLLGNILMLWKIKPFRSLELPEVIFLADINEFLALQKILSEYQLSKPLSKLIYEYCDSSHMLPSDTQLLLSPKIFEPFIPQNLPQQFHFEARKIQWQLWNEKGPLEQMQEMLRALPERFDSQENFETWIKPFISQNLNPKVKKLFEDVSKALLQLVVKGSSISLAVDKVIHSQRNT